MSEPNKEGEMVAFVEVDGVGVALFQNDAGLKLTVSGSEEFIKEIPNTPKDTEALIEEFWSTIEPSGNEMIISNWLRKHITPQPTPTEAVSCRHCKVAEVQGVTHIHPTPTIDSVVEIEHRINTHAARLFGYLQQIHDSGQYRCAEMELEKVLENVELLTTLSQQQSHHKDCGCTCNK